MKLFPQLALVSAIAISGNAMAMQALDDATLSDATGQDGITIAIKPPTGTWTVAGGATNQFASTGGQAGIIAIDKIYVHDKGGLAVADGGTATSGAIVLTDFKIAGNDNIVVKIDADSNAGNPLLNVNIKLPEKLVIRTGEIGVANSNRVTGTAITDTTLRGVGAAYNKVLSSIDIELGGAALNVQLGGESTAQNAMIKLSGTIANGLTITGLELVDGDGIAAAAASAGPPATARVLGTTGGSIYIGAINIRDTDTSAGTKLTLDAKIDVSANGLILTAGGAKTDIFLADVRLGNVAASAALGNADTTRSIGDVEIVGMNGAGTQIAISGH